MAPIEDYALLGDLHTAALVGRDGAIDWLCLPRFDHPACFAALLGDEDAGTWRLAPAAGGVASRRSYRSETLVLESEWDTSDGTVRVIDCMPPRDEITIRGATPVHLVVEPGFDPQIGSSAMIANSLHRVLAARAGWLTVADLPPAHPRQDAS